MLIMNNEVGSKGQHSKSEGDRNKNKRILENLLPLSSGSIKIIAIVNVSKARVRVLGTLIHRGEGSLVSSALQQC